MTRFGRTVMVAVLVLGALEAATQLPLRIRWLLLTYVAAFGVLAVLRHRLLLARGPLRNAAALAFLVSIVPVFAQAVMGHPDPGLAVLEDLIPTLIGWSVFLVLLPLADDSDAPTTVIPPEWRPSRPAAAGFLVASFILLTIVHALATGDKAVVSDEAVYLTQSRWITMSSWTWRIDPDLAPFFIFRKVDHLDGQLFGMYPPGWPALLALFRLVGLEWWSSVILGMVSVALIYFVGKRLGSARAGAVAALLLATSPFYLVTHAGYMAHASTICALLAATLCLLAGIDARGGRRMALFVGAGLLLGYVVTVRPLTGVVIGVSIGVWMLSRAWTVDRKVPLVLAACVAVGGVPPAAFLFSHNLSVFGDPLTLAYSVMHPGMYDLGFGRRGFRVLDQNQNWVTGGTQFGPGQGLARMTWRLLALNTTFVPVGMLAPIVASAVALGYRIRWGLVALFALLPLTLFFYWGPSLRQYSELFPFLILGAAFMLVHIADQRPRLAAGLLALVLAAHVMLGVPWPQGAGRRHMPWATSDYAGVPGRKANFAIVDSLARVHGRVLLFSREASRFDNQIDELYQYNGSGFDGPVVVARDRGALNSVLMQRLPDRVAFLIEDKGGQEPGVFTRISP